MTVVHNHNPVGMDYGPHAVSNNQYGLVAN